MLILKQIAFITTQIFLCTVCFAQRETIDSLKSALSATKDSARIDCFNALSEAYLQIKTDSARLYAQSAFKEAEKINYIKGKAKACNNLGRVESILSTDFPAIENSFSKGLEYAKQIPDDMSLHGLTVVWGMPNGYKANFLRQWNRMKNQHNSTKRHAILQDWLRSINF